MKVIVFFVVLIVVGLEVEGKNHNKHARNHDKYSGHAVRQKDSCRIVCDGDGKSSSTTPSPSKHDGSWLIDYNLPNNFTITIAYNQSANYFASFNTQLQLASIYAGSLAYIGIYNATSNSTIIINIKTGETKYKSDVDINFSTETNITDSFSIFYDYILEQSNQPAQTNLFNINGFLQAIYDGSLGLFFNGQQGIYNGILQNFGGLINSLQKNAQNGIGSIFQTILSGINGNVLRGLVDTFNSVIQSNGFFSQNFISAIYKGILNLRDGYFNSLSNAVSGVGKFYENLQGALNAFFSGNTYNNVTTKEVIVGNSNVSIDTGITNNNSWIINIGNKPGSTINMTIHYNATINILAFYNINLTIATVFNGQSGLYAIFNTTSGQGLVISSISGNAKLVHDNKIEQNFKNNNYKNGFILISKLILKSTSVNNTVNLEHDVFSFRDLLLALASSNGDYKSQFQNRGELLNKLITNFGVVFEQARIYFRTSGNSTPGPLNILSPIFGVFNLGQSFVNLIGNIFNSALQGRFNPNLMVNVFSSFVNNIESGINGAGNFIFGGIVNAIKGVETVGNDVGKALQNIFRLPSANFSLYVNYGQ